jgi:hypothetical protein
LSFQAGDIVGFQSPTAGYRKWHLCVNADGWFLHLNSPKGDLRPSDVELDCSELPGIPPTESGKSLVSCNMVLRMRADQLELFEASKDGEITKETGEKVLAHVLTNRVLSALEKRPIIEGLGGFVVSGDES